MDWRMLSTLDFEAPDHEKFPSIGLAYDVIRAGGTAGAIFNAANEAAVHFFLERRIRFGRIVQLVAEALETLPIRKVDSLETAMQADTEARDCVKRAIDN